MILDASNGFLWFAVSLATVKFVALNLKEVGNYGDFIVSSNNDAKIPLKQMIKLLGNSTYKVSLKKTLGGWEIYMYSFMWKLTYIALC